MVHLFGLNCRDRFMDVFVLVLMYLSVNECYVNLVIVLR